MDKNKDMKKKKAFTLGETIVVLVVLGIVSAITIPQVVRRHMEARDRAKIKKAMTVYDFLMNKIIVENQLMSDTAIEDWADDNCNNSSSYFKVSTRSDKAEEGKEFCRFKTPDGVWWDIENLLNPRIALNDDDLDDEDNAKTFDMVAHIDGIGALRVNDLGYHSSHENDVEDALENVSKLYDYINNKPHEKKVKYYHYYVEGNGLYNDYNTYDYMYYIDENGNKLLISKTTTDENGNIVDELFTDKDGMQVHIVYNTDGIRKAEWRYYLEDDPTGCFLSELNGNRLLSKCTRRKAYEYQLTNVKYGKYTIDEYYENGVKSYTENNIYGSTSYTKYNIEGKKIESGTYTLDANNNKIYSKLEKVTYNDDGTTTTCTTGANGNEICTTK